jgi:nucleoside-diphosphate-sugar epimerase
MPHVLIAGCGYVGTAAASLFLERGWEVTGWTRSGRALARDRAQAIKLRAVDVRRLEQVKRHAFACDVAIYCASSSGGTPYHYRRLYGDGVRNVMDAFPKARLIFTSSTSVYTQRDGSWVNEDSPTQPALSKPRILLRAEEAVLERAGIVLRLGGIYGPGRSYFFRHVKDGTAAISAVDRYVNQIHRDDAAAAILFFAERSQLEWPCLCNVVDNEPAPRNEILRWLAQQLEQQLLLSDQAPLPKRGLTNKRVSNARLRALGWSPRYPTYKQGFIESIFPAARQF